jgi:hypothetical protein
LLRLLLLGRFLFLFLELGPADKGLPPDLYERRQDDRENGVFGITVHLTHHSLLFALQALERTDEIIGHLLKWRVQRAASPDQNVVVPGFHRARRKSYKLAQPAADAIALDGIAGLFGDREADADGAAVVARPRLQHERSGRSFAAGCRCKEVSAAF